MVVLLLNIWGTSILFSIMAVPIYIPTNSVPGFPFLHFCANLLLFFLITAILTGLRRCLIVLWFAFPQWLVTLSTFSYACWPFVCLLWKNVWSDPSPFVFCFCPLFPLCFRKQLFSVVIHWVSVLRYRVAWVPFRLWILAPYWIHGLKIHSLGPEVAFSFCW